MHSHPPVKWIAETEHKFRLTMRSIRFWWQRRTRGWDDSELWNLDNTIAQFVHPRLKRLQEVGHGYPGGLTPKKWAKIVDDMLFAFDRCSTVRHNHSPEDEKRIERGLRYFGKYFRALWD